MKNKFTYVTNNSSNISNSPMTMARNPLHHIIDKYYLNEVSMKYRYDLMEYSKIGAFLGHKYSDNNLFDKVNNHNGPAMDKDIQEAYRYLKREKIVGRPNADNFIKIVKTINPHMHTKSSKNLISPLSSLTEFRRDSLSNVKNTLNSVQFEPPNIKGILKNSVKSAQISFDEDYTINTRSNNTKSQTKNNSVNTSINMTGSNSKINSNSRTNTNKIVLKKITQFNLPNETEIENKLRRDRKVNTLKKFLLNSESSNNINYTNSPSLSPLKKVEVKKAMHERQFSLYNKNKLAIDEKEFDKKNVLDSPVHRKEELSTLFKIRSIEKKKTIYKKRKYSPMKASILVRPISEEFNLDNFYDSPDPTNREYDKINYDDGGAIQLIKNYLINPKVKQTSEYFNFVKEHNQKSPVTNKGHIALHELLSEAELTNKEEQAKLFTHSENGQLIIKKLKGHSNKKTVRRDKSNLNTIKHSASNNNLGIIKLPVVLPPIIVDEDEKQRLGKMRSKNSETVDQYTVNNRKKFANLVTDNKTRLSSIDKEIKLILSKASDNYDKVNNYSAVCEI